MTTYPPKGCIGANNCKACREAGFMFRCHRCFRKRPWCVGCSDAHPNICDACHYAIHSKGKPCRACWKYEHHGEAKTRWHSIAGRKVDFQ